MDLPEIRLLPARGRAQFRLSCQIRRRAAHGVPAGRTRLSRIDRRTGESKTFCRFCRRTLPEGLGGIRETGIWRTLPGAWLSRAVYASCCDQQSPSVGLRSRERDLPLEGLCSWQQAAEDDPFVERVPPPFHPTHFAARFRSHPAVWISGQHASLGPTCPRAPTSFRRARTHRAISTSHRRQVHLPMSSLQWRNADGHKSVRPSIGFPVQISGQLVEHAIRRGPITCPWARAHSCLCGTRDSLLPRSHSVRTTLFSALRHLWTLCKQPSRPLLVSAYLHGGNQNPRKTLVAP